LMRRDACVRARWTRDQRRQRAGRSARTRTARPESVQRREARRRAGSANRGACLRCATVCARNRSACRRRASAPRAGVAGRTPACRPGPDSGRARGSRDRGADGASATDRCASRVAFTRIASHDVAATAGASWRRGQPHARGHRMARTWWPRFDATWPPDGRRLGARGRVLDAHTVRATGPPAACSPRHRGALCARTRPARRGRRRLAPVLAAPDARRFAALAGRTMRTWLARPRRRRHDGWRHHLRRYAWPATRRARGSRARAAGGARGTGSARCAPCVLGIAAEAVVATVGVPCRHCRTHAGLAQVAGRATRARFA
jgi:hypothetical protein